MNKQIFSKVLILIIFFALAGGGIFVWQRTKDRPPIPPPTAEENISEQTADWNTCIQSAIGLQKNYTAPSLELNFDDDADKEIVGVCEPDAWGGYLKLFVLDKQSGEYKPVLTNDRGDIRSQPMRYYKFANLKINDIDKDGIDEIIYEEKGWGGGSEDNWLHVYSPKYKEDFWRDKWWSIAYPGDLKKDGVTFSSNFGLEEYKIFKEFLSR